MAVSNFIKNKNIVYLSLGYNVNQAVPLDARLVVTTYDGLTQASMGDNVFYDGIVVSVVDDPVESKNGLYQLIHMPASDINNWHKLASVSELQTALSNADVKINVNGVDGTKVGDKVNVVVSGDSITLGNTYAGQIINGRGTTSVSPSTGDTVNGAIKKIVDIIIDNEKVTAAALNDLNDRIKTVSGNSVTNVALDSTKTKLLVTKNGVDVEIPLTDLANIYSFDNVGDATHNVKLSTKVENDRIVVQGNVDVIDCGEYEGNNA